MRKIIETIKYKQAGIQRWNDVEGRTVGLLGAQDLSDVYGHWTLDPETQFALTTLLKYHGILNAPEEASYKVNIMFTSSGHNDPGNISGGPDDWYAPEGEEERTIQEVTLKAQDFNNPNIDGKEIELPQPLAKNIGEYFRKEIDSIELSGYDE